MYKLDLEKAEEPEIKLSAFFWIIEKVREFLKVDFCFFHYTKAFDCLDHKKLWKILKEMGIWDYLTCLLRNLYAGQEATVRTRHGRMGWFKILKGVCQDCILSPCYFILCAEYIMQNTGLDKSQAETKIVRRNINNLRYADDTIPMADIEEELKSDWMSVEESEKAGLKLNIQKPKIMATHPISSRQIAGEKVEAVTEFIFVGSKITVDSDCSKESKGSLPLERKAITNIDSLLKSRNTTLLTKCPYSQSCGFSSSHVRMWELDHKEGWVLKNWCFWILVPRKTLRAPWTAGDQTSQS